MMDSENMVMHSDSITNIFDISCEVLEQYLKTKSNVMLVIDCRPFLAHNESHIVNAINVHCPPILRRRTGGRLPLKTIITDIVVRERLIAGQFFPVILYEDTISNSSESTCGFVARCLQQETSLEFIYILKGGFQQFAHRYPNSCTRNGHLISPGYSNLIKSPSAGHLTWLTVKNGTTVGSFYKGNHSPRTPKALNTIYGPLYMDNSIPLVTRESDQGEPVEILPYLYLGSGYHASCKRNLEKLGITALLNVSQNCPNHFEDTFTYKCIPVEDSSSEEISLWFDEAIDFIDSIKQSNGKVLVHCRAGISRSATICMAYLMATKKLRMEESYEFVKSRRRIVSPNFNFMGQLLGFEAKLFNSPNVNEIKSFES